MEEVKKLLRVIEAVRVVDREMPAQTLAALLQVALNEGVGTGELEKILDVAQSTTVRLMCRLGEWEKYPTKPGLGLIKTEIDLRDRRLRRNSLTAKGRALVSTIVKEMK